MTTLSRSTATALAVSLLAASPWACPAPAALPPRPGLLQLALVLLLCMAIVVTICCRRVLGEDRLASREAARCRERSALERANQPDFEADPVPRGIARGAIVATDPG